MRNAYKILFGKSERKISLRWSALMCVCLSNIKNGKINGDMRACGPGQLMALGFCEHVNEFCGSVDWFT